MLFGLMPRRPDVTPEEFHDRGLCPHGTLDARTPAFRSRVEIQQRASALLGCEHTPLEAVAEGWFDTVGRSV
jgi:hypothetical protein